MTFKGIVLTVSIVLKTINTEKLFSSPETHRCLMRHRIGIARMLTMLLHTRGGRNVGSRTKHPVET